MYDYRKLVFDSLDSSYTNGYDMSKWSAKEIAHSLIDFDSNFMFLSKEDCINYIHEWQEEIKKIEFNKYEDIEEDIDLE